MKSWEAALLVSNTFAAWLGLALAASKAAKLRAEQALEAEPERRVTADRLVSIVVPTLQEENYLPKLFTSIRHQSYFPIEIVVGDGSPMESYLRTQQLCQSFGGRIVHRPELNLPAARNEGARQAQGEILLFSDADNILDRYCVERLVRWLLNGYMLTHPIEAVYDDGVYGVWVTIFRDWFKQTHWTTRCVAIWRDAFFAVGGYNESYDPNKGFREDLQLGQDVITYFGENSIRLVRDAFIATSMRRERAFGALAGWVARGVRDGVIDHV